MSPTAEHSSYVVNERILGVNVSVTTYDLVVQQSLAWALERKPRALVFANVHVVMEAVDNPAFLRRLNRADMINPDGMPLVWTLRWMGQRNAVRVYGPDATLAMLAAAETAQVPVGFYGGSQRVLEKLISEVGKRHPRLKIAFRESPPFRTLSPEEDAAVVDRLASSETRILFVGLGCPKQENWILDHTDTVSAVMFGVGAAFDFLAGTKAQAPRWMMRSGLEWAFRFAIEPRRLWRRYIISNPKFLWNLGLQFLGVRRFNVDV